MYLLRFQPKLLLCLAVAALAAACATTIRNVAPPVSLHETQLIGVASNEFRFWGDTVPEDYRRIVRDYQSRRGVALRKGRIRKSDEIENILILSGGGSDGAFGSGLLNGWSQTGTRPKFKVVTGVSTGALIAPFAFLGSSKDHLIREFYTTHSTKDLIQPTILQGILGGEAISSSAPLAGLIKKYLDRETFDAIAREYKKGRYLMIGTTNIDAQRPVIWDMGKIASIGTDAALHLFRKVILASASIGGAFPPVQIDVLVKGQVRQELHVDGGTTDNIVLVPFDFSAKKFDAGLSEIPNRRLYVLINSQLAPQWHETQTKAIDIAGRSISTLIKQQTIGDVLRLYDYAKLNKMDFNIISIPPDFEEESKEPFDRNYMTALYDVGLNMGRNGIPWRKSPKYR